MRQGAFAGALFLMVVTAGCGAPVPQAWPDDRSPAQALPQPSPDQPPFPTATSVRLFVNSEGPNPAPTGGLLLTAAQRREFEAALHGKQPPPREDQAVAACFFPHHFFRYYDAGGAQVGEVAVCFCCSGVALKPADGADRTFTTDYERIGRLVKSLGLPTDVNCDE